jgi:hypothetical protein
MPKEVKFLLIDANSDIENIKNLRAYVSELDRDIRICETHERTSLSEAWNLGIMLSNTRYAIFASSDVEFLSPYWFTLLESASKKGSKYTLIENHAVFMIDKSIISDMGWFDEGYSIGPHFDTDFMIRAGEAGIAVDGIANNNLYNHGHDDPEVESKRVQIKDDDDSVKDRLPMNDKTNEDYFKEKWASGWGGWDNFEHPPNHISQVIRKMNEVDCHPFYTRKLNENFNTGT